MPVPSNNVVGYNWYSLTLPEVGDGNAFAVIVAVSSVVMFITMPACFIICWNNLALACDSAEVSAGCEKVKVLPVAALYFAACSLAFARS